MVIYCVKLSRNVLCKLNNLCNLLSAQEVHYGFNIKHADAKTTYFASKILTRLFLSKYAGYKFKPNHWRFALGQYGKPRLTPAFNDIRLNFNVSHCGNLYTIAIDEQPLGLDVESYHFKIDDVLAKTVFSNLEIAKTSDYTTSEIERYYLRLWTIKESFAKQSGLGINAPFQRLTAQQIAVGFFKVKLNTQIDTEILTKNILLEIENEDYSLSVSARRGQLSSYSVEIINDENWCFQDLYPFHVSNVK